MRASAQAWLLPFAVVLGGSSAAHATGFTDTGQDIEAHPEPAAEFHGHARVRTDLFYNLDLDRGVTPSGAPLFPVPLSDPTGQALTHADMRLRTDLALYAPGRMVAVKARIDALDNLVLGSAPRDLPSATTTQRPPEDAFVVKRAYGEVLLPFGLLAAGRMGSQFGLGILSNGGDCLDCDSGDATDRIAFLTPLAGHVWAAAYDFSASGPFTERRQSSHAVDLDPSDDVRTLTFAVLSFRTDEARTRRRRAGRTTVEYGALVSHRFQERDVPAAYVPTTHSVPITPAQSVARNARITAVDGWIRITHPRARMELETVFATGRIDEASLIPGVTLRDSVRSTQYGAALESAFGAPESRFGAGIDLGAASGDPAPGFGAFVRATDAPPEPGDLDGPQLSPPRDRRVDNFRFHPDYRVDRILFREIIGTVTDALYVRPHARLFLSRFGTGSLRAELATVASWALRKTSTPGGARGLGVEVDPSVIYEADGFTAAVEYAALFPLAGLDNPATGMGARPAQRLRLLMGFAY